MLEMTKKIGPVPNFHLGPQMADIRVDIRKDNMGTLP